MSKNTLQQLKWRAAIKSYDASKKLSKEQAELLEETARLAPTSYGLQPLKLIVITDQKVKEKLKSAGYNQSQFTDASHVYVLAARDSLSENDVTEYMQRIADQRGVEKSSLDGFADVISGSISHKTSEEIFSWNARQAYILLGMMLMVAAEHKIDTTPMEGFANDKFDEILGLDSTGYKSVVAMVAGFRAEDDKYSQQAKVRKSDSEFITKI